MDDNINLDLSLTIGPPPRPSPPPRLAEYRSATSPTSIFRPIMDDNINLDLSLTIGPPPRSSPLPRLAEYRSATSPTTIFRPIIPPICSPHSLSKTEVHLDLDLDLSLRLAYPKSSSPPPPPSESSPSNFSAASTSALMKFDAEYSASSQRWQQWRDGSSSELSSIDMRRLLQLSPPTAQASTPLPPPSSLVDPSPSQVSASASTSSPPSPQHHYPRPLPPGRYTLVHKIGSNSSSAPFPKRRRSDLTAIPPPVSRVANRAPDAAVDNSDEERILEPISFPWASDRPAGVRSLVELRRLKITKVKGRLRCNSCNRRVEKEYEIEAEFNKLAAFVVAKEGSLNDRAPEEWMRPAAVECPNPRCGKLTLRAEMPAAEKVEEMNWLFMLLGGTLAQCNLKQLKYFCRNNGNLHRSGAKDRLLYKTYMCLCSQLDPDFRSRLRKEVAEKMAFESS